MKTKLLSIPVLFILGFSLLLVPCCKTSDPVTTATTSDTTAKAQQKNPIHSSGKVPGGTFINGPGQDSSTTGSKPKQ